MGSHGWSIFEKLQRMSDSFPLSPCLEELGSFHISGIHWAIVGGESGRGARPMKQEWVENILRICRDEKVAFFFKQWGGVHKTLRGRRLHRRIYDEMPRLHSNPMPSRHQRSTAATLWDERSTRWVYPATHISPCISAASGRGIASSIAFCFSLSHPPYLPLL